MPFDWFTVLAQLINFLLLVWLLKKLLYQPVLAVIERRRREIERSLTEVSTRHQAATDALSKAEAERAALADEREALLRDARQQALAERDRLLAAAQQDYSAQRERWHAALNREQLSLQQQLSTRAQTEVLAIVRQILADLADEELAARIVSHFARQLKALPTQELARIRGAIAAGGTGVVTVKSASEIGEDQRRVLQQAVDEAVGQPLTYQYETRDGLIAGLEIHLDGHKMAWSISDYMSQLSRNAERLLEQQLQSQSDAADG
ncbi:MAG: hypothetical protein H6978_02520 [Gammaproteobacteria bacterium]|nr:hypothetical protein [Gammaproteobacteria bacterium]